MKVIKYAFRGCEKMFPWSEDGEEIAAAEADNGEYIVEEITEEQAKEYGFITNREPTTDDVINTLLGVTK